MALHPPPSSLPTQLMTRILTTIFTGSDTCLEMIYWTKIEILEIARRYLHQQLHHHHHRLPISIVAILQTVHLYGNAPVWRLFDFCASNEESRNLCIISSSIRCSSNMDTIHIPRLSRVLVFLFDHRRESEIGNLAVAACYYSEMARQ